MTIVARKDVSKIYHSTVWINLSPLYRLKLYRKSIWAILGDDSIFNARLKEFLTDVNIDAFIENYQNR